MTWERDTSLFNLFHATESPALPPHSSLDKDFRRFSISENGFQPCAIHPPERTASNLMVHSGRTTKCVNFVPVLTPPLRLESSSKTEKKESEKQKNLLHQVLELLKSIRPGADLTKFQVPVRFNLPKTQLQVYGETIYCCDQDLLSRCAEAKTPLGRFLNVVAWHISTTRPAPFAMPPLNPVLGETHHVSCRDLNVILEQVSHHPPITALYATNKAKKIQLLWWHSVSPRFYVKIPSSSVEATINGSRFLTLSEFDETYELTCPKLCFRFFPIPGTEWAGTTTVKCPQSGLEASICFKSKSFFGLKGAQNQVSGKIFNMSSGHVLYELNGNWSEVVTLKDSKTGGMRMLYDAQVALANLKTPALANPQGLAPTESVVVWSNVMAAILASDWDRAREAKKEVEERQRDLRKQRDRVGSSWSPKYFTATVDGKWEWSHQGQDVPIAPIVVESPQSYTKSL